MQPPQLIEAPAGPSTGPPDKCLASTNALLNDNEVLTDIPHDGAAGDLDLVTSIRLNPVFQFAREVLRRAEELDDHDDREPHESPALARRASFASTRSTLARKALDSLIAGPATLPRNRIPSQVSRTSATPALVPNVKVVQPPSPEEELSSENTSDDDDASSANIDTDTDTKDVADRIQIAFDLPQMEPYKGEFACYLARSVLLKGYMFVTSDHICFYATLPRETAISKAGYLSKRSSTTHTYTNYWFLLKDDVLTFYANSTNIYFPFGSIDMKKVLSVEASKKRKNGFKIQTPFRKYHLTADTELAVQEWLHILQASMFRAKNEADDVRIVLPFAAVADMQLNRTSLGVDMLSIRISDDDDVSEAYLFTYFNDIGFAYQTLHAIWVDVKRKVNADATRGRILKPVSMYDSTATSSLPPRPTEGASPTRNIRSPSPALMNHQRPRPLMAIKPDSPAGATAQSQTLLPSPTLLSPASTSSLLSTPAGSNTTIASTGAGANFNPSAVLAKIPRVFHRRTQSDFSAKPTNDVNNGNPDHFESLRSMTSPTDSQSLSPERQCSSSVQERGSITNGSCVAAAAAAAPPPPPPPPQVSFEALAPANERPPSPDKRPGAWVWSAPFTHRKTPSDAGPQYWPDITRDNSDFRCSSPDRQSFSSLQERGSVTNVSAPPEITSPEPSTYLNERPLSPDKRQGAWAWTTPFTHRKTPSDAGVQYWPDIIRDNNVSEKRREEFVKVFGVPESEDLLASSLCHYQRIIPRLGRMYLSDLHVCFNSNLISSKMMIPLSDVIMVRKEKSYMGGLLYHALSIITKDQQEFTFSFYTADACDFIHKILEPKVVKAHEGVTRAAERRRSVEIIRKQVSALEHIQQDEHAKSILSDAELNALPPLVNEVKTELPKPMHITCLTIGTRGDVQPYIALGKRLMEHGHTVRIATHLEYKDWIEGHGLEFGEVTGNPAALIALCVDNGMFTVSFMREGLTHFRGWFDELLESGWEACKGTDLIIQSPTAFSGVHIAEAMNIPYFSAFPMPWTKTRTYPHPFAVPEIHMGGSYNYMSYITIDTIMWKFMQYQINSWRKKVLDRPPVSSMDLSDLKLPFLYSFSPSVVPYPPDWADTTHICGYWFLDNPEHDWTPPPSLIEFMNAGPKPIYIGFGSIVVPDPDEMTNIIIEAVKKAGVRAILSKGWSARGVESKSPNSPTKAELFPDNIFPIASVPHDWLFPQLAGVVHHGGAGTAAAGMRAGVPTLIKPFFGDQFFWAERLSDLGVGLSVRKFTIERLAEALVTLTTDVKMAERAKLLGSKIRSEDGIGRAVEYIYRDLDYSRRLVNKLHNQNSSPLSSQAARPPVPPTVAAPGPLVVEAMTIPAAKTRPSSWHASAAINDPC
ncbi:undecaprenyldiphospho-muramoylpentapeptide beta-N-acetylglucosaminyltransferase [Synchytrium endobioticum]|uniref:sterol 3beta-glucosyltransferase n=1 Tax=Synchytrium endobioticum TaxID=286115 RepID=A0A507DF71_9FUNG|nr:undecaprenyldiphospho-muramoylpentapeptide beta-N-acetylglucosaminyltransferase [Synchytrium endobioticum]TPX50342.1 undecaprenyldiphospho-muramoylpentapeptide beta-N-acetylglucosaminyltransferase [Synchytrium endobioticum]